MNRSLRFAWSIAAAALLAAGGRVEAAQFEVSKDAEGVDVKLDGKLLTRYIVKSGHKPILWPLIGPNGQPITRQYPMKPALPTEKEDHIHHRSFWFTHGDVNGVDFWAESDKSGNEVHREFVEVKGGDTAVIVTRNDWVGRDGKKQCEDIRRLTFGVESGSVYIDFDTTVTASEGPTVFGETKEGCFGVRVAGTMDVDAKKGGRIVTSEGLTDKDAWGKQAAWCDYHGPVEGDTVGIAILNHPKSFRYPTYWHVRTYGLFTANPFGIGDFGGGPKGSGKHEMAKGDSFSLYYRVLLHKGDEKQGGVAEAFEKYKAVEKAAP